MLKKHSISFLAAFFCALSLLASEPLEAAKEAVASRWAGFEEGRSFIPFRSNRSDEELISEFEKIHKLRQAVWETPGFERADLLFANDLIRAPGCAAFAYNNTAPYYNASTVFLGGKIYIACEGPRSKDIPSFFKLLSSYGVTHVVRLTDSYEGASKKCHPYWEGLLFPEPDGAWRLEIPLDTGAHWVRAYDLAHWRDHQGIAPAELLDLVLKIRGELEAIQGLLAVHCSAGVGRTGTFLAALAIVDAIDLGEPFSIEEIIYRLSLQRIQSVAKAPQYVTLHRLAELYLAKGSTGRPTPPDQAL